MVTRNIGGYPIKGSSITGDIPGDSIPWGAAGYPVDVAATEADGTAITAARSDHGHALGDGSATSRIVKPDFASASFGNGAATPNVQTDIVNATVTFTPAVSSLVQVSISMNVQNNTAARPVIIYLVRDGTNIGQWSVPMQAAANGQFFAATYWDDAISAASHTYKLAWKNTTAGDSLAASNGVTQRLYAMWWAT